MAQTSSLDLTYPANHDGIFCEMAISLDLIDVKLLDELQTDADRPNVELARLVDLSPAATLHRVRRLKESGIVRSIRPGSTHPRPVSRSRSTSRSPCNATATRITGAFATPFRAMPEVISADWVTGETDAMLLIVAREVAQLQRVLVRLRRGAARRG